MSTTLIQLLSRPISCALLLFITATFVYGIAALNFPVVFNLDNQANYEATKYLLDHHALPIVDTENPEIYFTKIGTTRSLRPPFTYIVSALAASATTDLIDNQYTRLRMGSPLIAAATVVVMFFGFYIAFGNSGIAVLGAGLIGLMPKFVFLASCNNDDIGAIFSVTLLFTCVLALLKYADKPVVWMALAASIGVVLQTKFTAWLALPWFGLFCLYLVKSHWRKLIRLVPMLLLVCVIAGAWWPLFNMFHYGWDDPSALRYGRTLQVLLNDIVSNQQGYLFQGIGLAELLTNHDQFLSITYKSLIGYLQWLDLEVGMAAYTFYAIIFVVALLGIAFRSRAKLQQTHYLDYLILAAILAQFMFYLHHNLVRDIQPQARYILPMIMPVMYLFLRLITQIPATAMTLLMGNHRYQFQSLCVAIVGVLGVLVFWVTMQNYVLPSYIAKPFHTIIKATKIIPLEHGINIISSESLNYRFDQQGLHLLRDGAGLASISLDPKFCDRLPLNSLISFSVFAPSKGGLHLRLDRNNRGTYNYLYWHSFQRGRSTIIFAVNSEDCSGVKLSLAENTFQVTLESLKISELRIHEHGRPI